MRDQKHFSPFARNDQHLFGNVGRGSWDVVDCEDLATKFIVSDHPVTLYNRRCFPGKLLYPLNALIGSVGTQTIFPLDLNHCLVITHLRIS